jgi:hypothetical protein
VLEPKIDGRAYWPCWLVKTHVMSLLETGRIGRAEFEAAAAWRRWCETLDQVKAQGWDTPGAFGHGGTREES